jgi:hypothetical protein
MPDYQNGKIYTIRCYKDPSLIYVGSTTRQLSKRWWDHKTCVKNKIVRTSITQKMIDLEIENFYIELYEMFPCTNKEELHKREGEITRLIGTVNKVIAGRSQKEYRQDHKEFLSEYFKKYNDNRKEEMKEYGKNRREGDKREEILQKKREYHHKNKEEISRKKKEKREQNKEEINRKQREAYHRRKNAEVINSLVQ